MDDDIERMQNQIEELQIAVHELYEYINILGCTIRRNNECITFEINEVKSAFRGGKVHE